MGDRTPSHSGTSPGHAARRGRGSLLWLVLAAGVVCVVGGLLALNLREGPPGKGVDHTPTALIGRWTTTAPRYAGRALRLTRDTVVLQTGPGQPPRRGHITSLRTWKEGLVPVLRIVYDAGDGPETMDLLLVGPDSMRLRNPREVLWTRAH
jgi:hypothetical protein